MSTHHTLTIALSLALAACGKDEPAPPKPAPAKAPAAPTAATPTDKPAERPTTPAPKAAEGPVPETIVPTVAKGWQVNGLAVAGDAVIWSEHESNLGERRLWKTPTAGGAPTKLHEGAYYLDLTATAEHVYWSTVGAVTRIPTGGGAVETVESGEVCNLAGDGTAVYAVAPHRLVRLDGTRASRDVPEIDLCAGELRVHGATVYWLGNPKGSGESGRRDPDPALYRLSLDAAPARVIEGSIQAEDSIRMWDVAGDQLVYLGDFDEGVLRRGLAGAPPAGSFAGNAISKLAVDADGTAYTLAQFQGDGDGSHYHIYRLNADGTKSRRAFLPDDTLMPSKVVVSGDHVYWYDYYKVQRAPKSG